MFFFGENLFDFSIESRRTNAHLHRMGILLFSWAFFLHTPLVIATSRPIEVDRSSSQAYEEITVLCRKEELQFSYCLVNWLRCHYKRNCGREYMLMKLICSVSSNQSRLAHEYSDCRDGGSEASLLVSPLVVAGIVIGLVLFLSCVTIIVGSLRKDGRLRNPHLRPSYAPDGFSYGGSIGELRSTCIEDFPPVFDFDSYAETLSQVNVMYPDSPPHYEECMGPGATHIYIPTDDPPPYSLTDPCQRRDMPAMHNSLALEVSDGSSSATARLHTIASISLTALPLEDAPPYEAVVGGRSQPIPLIPTDLLKRASADTSPQLPISHRNLLARASSSPGVHQ
ncbi:protein BEAN1-like [Anguilla anguilla]|uniref:protein BEAN1-like n=1 Tax=Anguilla anguilla TaxID=7936 RepID=UPI0015AF0320|nr:protein BEAN1-like [Anguilla anguilla]